MMEPASLPLRERAFVLSGLFAITALSWAYLWYLARDPMAMCMVNMNPWSAADLSALFAMWAVMMVGMMVPSALPMILAFAGVNRSRRAKSLSYVSTSTFVLGYVAAWIGFSIAATLAQEALHSGALVSSMGISSSRIFGGIVLMATGIFQWTPLKNACLRHCRSPIGFLLNDWRDGSGGAFQMGLRLGAYCVGCCWLLMGLLFVAGVMNLWWVAAITAFVLVEKVAPAGLWIARVSGTSMIVWGGWMLLAAVRS
jgi:predicted metal-binding membrane protein